MLRNIPRELIFCLFMTLVVLLIFYPGTSGVFLLDDFGTISALGRFNQIDSLDKLSQYVFTGFTGPGGRPVSLLTFAANAQTWPTDPYPFLLTNIFIHLINSLLLFLFVKQLLDHSPRFKSVAFSLAAFASLLWAIHPFYVSTVLYAVQRMTLLSWTFSLLVFLVYLRARDSITEGRICASVGLLLVAAIFSVLGFFSKENVVLLPLQLLLIEWYLSIAGKSTNSKWHRVFIWCCLVPAVVIVLAYPLKIFAEHTWKYMVDGVDGKYGRPFTLYERLFTQQRVLGDYITGLVVPRMQSAGVFYDNYPVSRELFSPITTFFWLSCHIAALGLSWLYRKRMPVIFFGVWWFYGSHVIESTVVMLELKFDHRNYIPGFGILLVLAFLTTFISAKLRAYVQGGAVLLLCFLTFMSSSLWGNPLKSAMVWLEENPKSQRAHEHAAMMHVTHVGYDDQAKELLRSGIALNKAPTAQLKYITVFCEMHDGERVDWAKLGSEIKVEPRNWSLYSTLEKLLERAVSNKCDLLTLDGYQSLLNGYRSNPVYKGTYSVTFMDDLEIRAALHFGDLAAAKLVEDSRDEANVPLAFKMKRAITFANAGHLEYAVEKLDLGIKTAEALRNETEFTLKNAREVLGLMKQDLPSSGKAPDD